MDRSDPTANGQTAPNGKSAKRCSNGCETHYIRGLLRNVPDVELARHRDYNVTRCKGQSRLPLKSEGKVFAGHDYRSSDTRITGEGGILLEVFEEIRLRVPRYME